jgi:hypothetical protein
MSGSASDAIIHIGASGVASTALQAGVLVAVLAVLALLARGRIVFSRMVLAVVATAIMTFALSVHFPRWENAVLAQLGVAKGHWNWDGKIVSIVATLILIAIIPRVSFKESGFRWSQSGGVAPAIFGGALICAVVWGTNYVAGTHNGANAEDLWYQATMPGLQEEPSFRGLMLVLLNQAFKDKPLKLLGAPIGWAAVASSVYFGMGHGLGWDNGHVAFDAVAIAVTGAIGFVLLWIKERTGSLILPILAHNAANFGDYLLF